MLEKVMEHEAKIIKFDAKMVPKTIPNPSKIHPKINAKIDAKFVVEKSSKNRAVERQRVAKPDSRIRQG